MSRIDSDKVNLGSSFIIPTSDEALKAQELVNAKNVANDIIAKAKMQAQQIISEAQLKAKQEAEIAMQGANAQVDSIVEQAKKEGFAKGYEDGQQSARNDLTDLVENLNKFVQSQFDIKRRIIKSAYTDMLNLIIMISDKVCHVRLNHDVNVLYRILLSAINELKEKEQVTLIVNPVMAKKIYDISDTLKNNIHSLKHIKIVEDNSVSADGAIVESIDSRIDSRVSSQIDELAQKLLTGLQSVSEDKLLNEIEQKNNG